MRAVKPTLTARQIEVVSFIALGLVDKEIADRLGISRKTVCKHVEHILDRLNVRNRAQAVYVFYTTTKHC